MKITPSLAQRACLAGSLMVLAGCTSLSGLDGSSSLSCKAPDGVTCDSVSGIYANAVRNNLPSQRSGNSAPTAGKASAAPSAPPVATPASAPAQSGVPSRPSAPLTATASAMPLRSSARILRLWFKPWEDADRDLYDQGYVYVQIDSGQWLIEHAQRQIREAYAPLRPPPRSAGPAPATGSGSANEPKEGFGARPPVKGAARPPFGGDRLPGLVPPASRPDGND
jgi:conjugal transfer pilus assembly protein TraV